MDDVDKLLFGDPDPPPAPPQPAGGAMQAPSAFVGGLPTELSDFEYATGLAGGGPQAQNPADEEAMMAHALRLSAEEPQASSKDDARMAEALRQSQIQAQTGATSQAAAAPELVPQATAPVPVSAAPPVSAPDAADDDEDAGLAEALRMSIEENQAHLSTAVPGQPAGDGAAAVPAETGGAGAEDPEDKLPSGRRIKWAGETGTLEQLEAMGFNRDLATKALLETQDDVQRAIEMLTLSPPAPDDDAPPAYEAEM
ncbi:hypothetical protein T484DRAFT_1880222, partial [Baffinella frigidus]